MNTMRRALLILALTLCATGCWENYSNGNRVGMVTKFSRRGMFVKTWEGALNLTQTGMNTSGEPFDFSIDKRVESQQADVVAMLDSAATQGWKVELNYHQVGGFSNFLSLRGETPYYVTKVNVLDRNPLGGLKSGGLAAAAESGRTVDTIYVVITGRASDR